ncbi:MAG: hypothetical protein NZ561_08460, partial [Phycisphaerae bacterium]|nr:hypothetical protein [Phycisphaerae bacterium]MDW8262671.1 hypothetical protein [Phycisphaerales bacterium]
MRRCRLFWLPLGLMIASFTLARPGVVITDTGQRFSGEIVERADEVVVTIRGMATTFPREKLVAIEYHKEFPQEFAERLASLPPEDVAGRIELARWAMDNRQLTLARDALESALAQDPNSAEAAELLRFVQGQLRLDARARARRAKGQEPSPAPQRTPTLLSPTDVQAIRRSEWRAGDNSVRVRVDPRMARLFAESQKIRPEAFLARPPIEQARQILDSGYATEEHRQAVLILSDPAPIAEFRRNVQPLILNGCASSGCHGGPNA